MPADRRHPEALFSILLMALMLLGGCQGRKDLRERLESPDPKDRIEAIHLAADGGHITMAPAIVDRLDDEDPAVRLHAILALEHLTGERLGYAYAAPRRVRLAAIDRWRAHLKTAPEKEQSTSAQATSAPESAGDPK